MERLLALKKSRIEGELQSTRSRILLVQEQISSSTDLLRTCTESKAVLSKTIELLTQCLVEFENVTEHLSGFVSEGMSFIYQEPYEIKFYFSTNTLGTTNGIWFAIKKDGTLLEDPKEDLGDGEFSLIALLLFFACFVKLTNAGNRVIFFDEPLPAVDIDAWSNLGTYLATLCKTYNIQIITSTHVRVPFGKTFTIEAGELVKVEEYEYSL